MYNSTEKTNLRNQIKRRKNDVNKPEYSEILSRFSIDLPLKPFGNGHINTTFGVGEPPRYILQKINTAVFTDPEGLMENVMAVTAHVRFATKNFWNLAVRTAETVAKAVTLFSLLCRT